MDKKMKSIVEELGNYVPMKNREQFINARATQVIASVANLCKLIEAAYDPQTSEDLQRRLINSIKSNDPAKFARKMTQIKESRTTRSSTSDQQ